MRRLLLAALLAAACGTGTDGKPVAPPTTPAPAPAPEPPPAPPGQVTGVRVVEVGETFIVWEWEPAEHATGYQADPFLADAPEKEPPLQVTVEPTVRVEGLEPGSPMGLFVRAIRETAGGRAEGQWSDYSGTEETFLEPRTCTDTRALARGYGHHAVLLDEWDGTPFPIYFDKAIPANEHPDAEHFFGVAKRLAGRIEEQIGYPIIELRGWLPVEKRTFVIRDADLHDCERLRPGEIIVTTIPDDTPYRGAARSHCAAFFWTHGDIDTTWDATFAHELFHLFAFGHSPITHPHEVDRYGGVPMSVRLTRGAASPRDLGVTFKDVDALRCIFPEGGR